MSFGVLRESIREGPRVYKRTLANLSSLSDEQIAAIRAVLRGEQLAPIGQRFDVLRSLPRGHVQAVNVAMYRLGFSALLHSRPSRERDLVCAMVAARVLCPRTKLATTRWWHTSTLAQEFGVSDAHEDDLYAAMDWLLERQGAIEKKLAARHLRRNGLVLYDLSSSYFEGHSCPLARFGYSRDGKPGKLQVNYGLVSAPGGCPVAISVYEGNTADAKTLLPQVQRVREQFGIEHMVIVGDRGIVSHQSIQTLRVLQGVDWITALKSPQIRTLLMGGALQMDLFDERNLLELTHPDFPGERLVACRNLALGALRAQKRRELLQGTLEALEKVRESALTKRVREAQDIGVRVGRVINRYKMAKHIALTIEDDRLDFHVREDSVAQEAALDGLYVLHTALALNRMDAPEVVRSYKSLSDVERAFRSMKTMDLKVRPIHHRLENRVRAHIFLCMLAYYVEWQMVQAWRSVLFADEDQAAKRVRDPVAPAKRSDSALRNVQTKALPDAPQCTAFRHYCVSSPPSFEILVVYPAPMATAAPPSTSLRNPTPSNSARSLYSKQSPCSQNPNRHFEHNALLHKGNCSRRIQELQTSRWQLSSDSPPRSYRRSAAPCHFVALRLRLASSRNSTIFQIWSGCS